MSQSTFNLAICLLIALFNPASKENTAVKNLSRQGIFGWLEVGSSGFFVFFCFSTGVSSSSKSFLTSASVFCLSTLSLEACCSALGPKNKLGAIASTSFKTLSGTAFAPTTSLTTLTNLDHTESPTASLFLRLAVMADSISWSVAPSFFNSMK